MAVDIQQDKSIFDLMGHSLAVHRLSQQIQPVANTNLTVLIQGETGTGKELVACFIHKYSQRASQPLMAIDCSVLSLRAYLKVSHLAMSGELSQALIVHWLWGRRGCCALRSTGRSIAGVEASVCNTLVHSTGR